jgi:acyl-CoA thioesterase FadM
MPRPKIEGIAGRGGAPDEISFGNPISDLDKAGYVGTLATHSELDFVRYLRLGDRLQSSIMMESISERKGHRYYSLRSSSKSEYDR